MVEWCAVDDLLLVDVSHEMFLDAIHHVFLLLICHGLEEKMRSQPLSHHLEEGGEGGEGEGGVGREEGEGGRRKGRRKRDKARSKPISDVALTV